MNDEHAQPGSAPFPNRPALPAEYWVEPTRWHRYPFVPYRPPLIEAVEGERRGEAFCDFLETRRSVRYFSDAAVPQAMIEVAVHAANTAPSGAHLQPWTFVATSDPTTKHAIRQAAEREERAFYHEREVSAWREALERLETDEDKSYLDVVPWIVVAFAQKHTPLPDGTLRKNYYVNESVGIACGLFIAALHAMGLSTLTHTPNPMTFLNELLHRPSHERAYILFPIGYPARDAEVPDLNRKTVSETLIIYPAAPTADPERP
ncbi:MAG: nitroreductase family protein [Jatrophihabitantaceae bacterium]